jgi:K+-transporting ATPase KdpF subunit
MSAQRTSCKEAARVIEYLITGVVAAGVAVYLAYALLFPEKF